MRTALLFLVSLASAACRGGDAAPSESERQAVYRELHAELTPVKLANCEFERFGDSHDGGYVMCRNLLADAKSLYSYGISASDEWGCSLSARLQLPVHQYDCFNTERPVCVSGASPVFHEECVGPARETREDRLFDSVQSQLQRNGDAGKRLVMKMDVEGSEWDSFLTMPDSVLESIDQLSVEFHEVDKPKYVEVIRKLKRHFHVVNVHSNNWVCQADIRPMTSLAYEVLFVNKRIGIVDEAGVPQVPNPLDAPNNAQLPDCQPLPSTR